MTEELSNGLTEHDVNVRHHVYRIMDLHLDRAFEQLDHLHKRGINDDDVIKALREGGYRSEADAYIEWAHCADPDLADVNNVTTNPDGVTDPGDSPSYADHPLNVHSKIMDDIRANSPDLVAAESDAQMQAAYAKLSDPAFIIAGHPFEVFHDGDGMTEPFIEAYICGSPDCSTEYDLWRQSDPECSGLSSFHSEERRYAAWEKHAAHLAEQIKDAQA